MADSDYDEAYTKTGIATILAVVALLLALAAGGLAFMANKRANDAFKAVQPVTQQPVQSTENSGPQGTMPTDQGVNSNGNGTTQGTNGIPPGAPAVDQ